MQGWARDGNGRRKKKQGGECEEFIIFMPSIFSTKQFLLEKKWNSFQKAAFVHFLTVIQEKLC